MTVQPQSSRAVRERPSSTAGHHRRILTAGRVLALGTVLTACGGDTPAEPAGPPSPAPASLTIAPREQQLTVGQAAPLGAIVRDARGNALVSRSLTWSSRDAGVATVATDGTVTAVAAGDTWIRAVVGALVDSARVVVAAAPVTPGPVARVVLDAAAVPLVEGDTHLHTATVQDAAGHPIAGLGLTWRSSDPGVATVDGSGRVTALRPGTTTITVRVHGVEAESVVQVTATYDFDLLYAVRLPAGGHALRRVDVRQATPTAFTLLTEVYAPQAVPSPDGFRIAFVCPNFIGDPALCVADREGGNRRLIASRVGEALLAPTWSPDGTHLAFEYLGRHGTTSTTGTTRIGVVRADGSDFATLTLDLPGAQYAPAWSPRLADSTERIAFAHDAAGTGAALRLWTMRPDGSDRRALTAGLDGVDTEPAWSPDGRTIAFQRSPTAAYGSLWLVDVARGVERRLYGGATSRQRSPAWSPDGRLVAFASAHEGAALPDLAWDIYTIWADGTRLARRTDGVATATKPAWQRLR